MKLMLHELYSTHSKLRAVPVDIVKCSGLALQRAGHLSPCEAATDDDGTKGSAEIHWNRLDATALDEMLVDRNRLTEDAAEGVAIAYLHARSGWVVKRRLQRGEFADWLMQRETSYLAVEVSGTAEGSASAR